MFASIWFPTVVFHPCWFPHDDSSSAPTPGALVYHISGTVIVDSTQVDITNVTVTPL